MADFDGQDLHGSRFERTDLSGSRFERTDLSRSEFRSVDLRRGTFRGVALNGVVMRDVDLSGADITADIAGLTINGVDVAPLIDAELDRRQPGRARMRPTDADGFRAAWGLLGELWSGTVARARRLDPDLLHESVAGEWSFVETLRHLVFATDAWIGRAVLGNPSPWDPLDLPWDEMPDTPGIPRDREVRPTLDEVLAVRQDRWTGVRRVLDELTDEALSGRTQPVEAPGWPEPHSYPLRQCLLVVLNEEWEHRRYAERDLAVLEARTSSAGSPPSVAP